MENKLIKINNKYGAKIGNKQVFTRSGAIEAYKAWCRVFINNATMEAAKICYEAEQDMLRIGFTPDELEAFENETYEENPA